MSDGNIEASLDAVSRALDHFAESLERGGFAAGAETYGKMAEVIVGQWLWAETSNATWLAPRFARVAQLAGRVDDQLRPYVEAMGRIRALEGMIAESASHPASEIGRAIIGTLSQAARPLTVAELRAAIGASTSAVRRELRDLVAGDVIEQVDGRVRRFVLADAHA